MVVAKITQGSLIVAFLVFIADQATKWAIISGVFSRSFTDANLFNSGLPPAGKPVTGFFNLVLYGNRGVAFSLFEGAAGRWVLIALALAIVAGMLVWLWRINQWMIGLAIGSIVGGALGNALDRFRLGAVVDFLDFHAFSWHWPAFNLADSAIFVGVGLLLLDGLFAPRASVE